MWPIPGFRGRGCVRYANQIARRVFFASSTTTVELAVVLRITPVSITRIPARSFLAPVLFHELSGTGSPLRILVKELCMNASAWNRIEVVLLHVLAWFFASGSPTGVLQIGSFPYQLPSRRHPLMAAQMRQGRPRPAIGPRERAGSCGNSPTASLFAVILTNVGLHGAR